MIEVEKIVILYEALFDQGVRPEREGTPAEQFMYCTLYSNYLGACNLYRDAEAHLGGEQASQSQFSEGAK